MLNGIYRSPAQERVVYGVPAAQALRTEVDRLGARRVLFVCSTSAQRSSPVLAIRAALAERMAGFLTGVAEHSPRESVLAIAATALECRADLIVALGGGSVIDACKAALQCIWRGVVDEAGFAALPKGFCPDAVVPARELAASPIRMIAVPTTFSGAEFTSFAGVTDRARDMKEALDHPLQIPQVVILDSAVTAEVPLWVLLSTGVRAIDHCVETYCSPGAQPVAEATALHAMRMLAPHLRALKADPHDEVARQQCQLGMWLAILGPAAGVQIGASHGIGRILGGALGVPHGRTSCVLLPSVLRWNAPSNEARQREFAGLLGLGWTDLADEVEALIRDLGEPTRLSDVGVEPAAFGPLADKVIASGFAQWNPRPVRSREDILEILELAR